jgi:hypothetical protein
VADDTRDDEPCQGPAGKQREDDDVNEDEQGRICVAPGCERRTASPYRKVCDACRKRVEEAMVRAVPSLLEAMHAARDEAEAWLLSDDWEPARRWAMLNEDYAVRPIDDVVSEMVELTIGWGTAVGFVDDGSFIKWDRWWQEHHPEKPRYPQTGWRLGDESPAGVAWRAHLAPLLQDTLTRALATFPLRHAGREIKDAIRRGRAPGAADDAEGGFEEIVEGTGGSGLSEDAKTYLDLRYYPDPTFRCDLEWADSETDIWFRYPVLAPEIMAILRANLEAEALRDEHAGEADADADLEQVSGAERHAECRQDDEDHAE